MQKEQVIMRGIPSLITEIRKKVFTEVARMAYSGDYTGMEDIPFKIVPGQSPHFLIIFPAVAQFEFKEDIDRFS